MDDVLVPIRCLVNGTTIAQEQRDEVTYYHIELNRHDVILAEGLPCESYLDAGNRAMFANCPVTELHPDFARPAAHAWAHDSCAPLVESGPQLEAIRARLNTLAGMEIEPPEAHQSGELRGWIDVATSETISGWAWQPDHPAHFAHLEILANDTRLGEVVAADQRDDVRDAGRLEIISNGTIIGHGDGRCGFTFRPPQPLSPFTPHIIRVRRAADGAELWNSGQITLPATQRLDAPSLTGFATALHATAASTASQAERAELLHFMARETDRLRTTLARASTNPPSQRDKRRLALFIDETPPAPDQDSASQVALDHMRALTQLGYRVAFAASTPGDTAPLEALGILLPPTDSVEGALRHLGEAVALVYLHRVATASLYSALVRHHCPNALLVYSVADLHFVRTARQAAVENSAARAAESRRLREREVIAAIMADRVITHSTAEAAILRQHAPKARVHVVPWSVPAQPTTRPFQQRSGLAFIGGYRHAPNVDAARWLMEAIMPLVWRQQPEVECLLVGSHMPDSLRRITRQGITPLGHVPDLATVFDRVRLTVAPLRYGAGIKGKVLASLAAGVPCVCTPVAAEGLALPPLLHAATPAELAAHILRLHSDEAHNAACAAAGLRLIETEFTPARIDQQMQHALGRPAHHAAEQQRAG